MLFAKRGRQKSAVGGTVPSKAKMDQMRNLMQKKNEDRQNKLRNASIMAKRRKEHLAELKPPVYLDAGRPLLVNPGDDVEIEGLVREERTLMGNESNRKKSGISLTRGTLPSWVTIPIKMVPESLAMDAGFDENENDQENVIEDREIKKIDRIRFSLLSNELTLKQSHLQVEHGPVYDRKSMEPRENGLNDLKLGPLNRNTRCDKCGNDIVDCPGHGAHLASPLACYSGNLIEKIHRSLCCLCYFCSSLLLTKNDKKLQKLIDAENNWKAFAIGKFDEAKSSNLAGLENDKEIAEAETAKMRAMRFSKIVAAMEKMPKKRCPNCKVPQPKYICKGLYLDVEWTPESMSLMSIKERESALRPFTPEIAGRIFDSVSEETAALMGVGASETLKSMIVRNIPVLPPIARPNIASFEGSKKRSSDYITQKMTDIQKVIRDLELAIKREDESIRNKTIPGDPAKGFDPISPKTAQVWQDWTRLQIHIGLTIDRKAKMGKGFGPASDLTEAHNGCNSDKVASELLKQEAQKHLGKGKALAYGDRMQGKDSRIRGNLAGKRVNFSARLVIGPDPNIAIDEVLIPIYVALSLTYAEKVFNANLQEMRKHVDIGFGRVGGAKSVIMLDGSEFFLDPRDSAAESSKEIRHIEIVPGMTVNRYMKNRDVVVINRQPSLHRISLQALYARLAVASRPSNFIHPYSILSILGINPQITKPFNADFDGDEMNLHFPQNEMARAEALLLMTPKVNLKHPQSNNLSLSPIQDCVYGVWHLVHPDTFLDEEQTFDLMAEIPSFERLNAKRIGPTDPQTEEARRAFKTRLGEPVILKPKRLWSGKQILSALLPEGFCYEKWPETRPAAEGRESTDVWMVKLAKGQWPWRRTSEAKQFEFGESDREIESAVDMALFKNLASVKTFANATNLNEEVLVGLLETNKETIGNEHLAIAWLIRERSEHLEKWRAHAEFLIKDEIEREKIFKADELMTKERNKLNLSPHVWDANLRNEAGMVIRDGDLILGESTSSHFGGSTGSVLHRMAMDKRWGSARTINFLTTLQRVIARFLDWRSTTVSLGDCQPIKKEDSEEAKVLVEHMMQAARDIMERCKDEGIDPGRAEIEALISDIVGKSVFDALSAKAKKMYRNNLYRIVRSGAKGNFINLVQILMSYGQITVAGCRNFSSDPKCGVLPSFAVGDNDPLAKGFVPMGLGQGLGPVQQYNSFKAGREGLSDTAVKTSETGYFFRRMFKAMEAVMEAYDGTIRNSNNEIISPWYGDGNYDPKNLSRIKMEFLMLSDKELANAMGFELPVGKQHNPCDPEKIIKYAWYDGSGKWASCHCLRAACKKIQNMQERSIMCTISCFERVRYFRDRIRNQRLSPFKPDLEIEAYLPFDPKYELDAWAKKIAKSRNNNEYRPAMEPVEAVFMVRQFTEKLRTGFYDAYCMRSTIELCLTPNKLTAARIDSKKELQDFLNYLEYIHETAKVEPGEMIGSVASQCIGEPATQMTLK